MERELFFSVQKLLDANRGKGGRTGKKTNLFTHLVKCPYCDGSLTIQDKGDGYRLVCYNNTRGLGCGRNPVSYVETEKTILENCAKLDIGRILPDATEQQVISRQLREKLDGIVGEIERLDKQLEQGAERVLEAPSDSIKSHVYRALTKLEDRKHKLRSEQQSVEAELEKAELDSNSVENWKDDLAKLRKSLESGDISVRQSVNIHLRELLDKIEIFGRGHSELRATQDRPPKEKRPSKKGKDGRMYAAYASDTRDGECFAEEIEAAMEQADPKFARSRQFREFLVWVTRKRMSKAGRFIRLHFKTGAKVDIVPDGSIASGVALVRPTKGKNKWRFVSPELDREWRHFASDHRKCRSRAKLATT